MKNITNKVLSKETLEKNKRNEEKEENDMKRGLSNLFVDELREIYWAEKAMNKAIPKVVKSATAHSLVETLAWHLAITKAHVTTLEKVFSSIGEKPETQKCKAMLSMVKEAKATMKETQDGMVRDAAIISAVKKVDHYAIATYETLCLFAKALRNAEASDLLRKILEEERLADGKLSEAAELFAGAEGASTNKDAVTVISFSDSKQTQLV